MTWQTDLIFVHVLQTTPSSFGGLHAALLSLSTRICGPQNWISQVEPSSDAEREDSMHLVLCE